MTVYNHRKESDDLQQHIAARISSAVTVCLSVQHVRAAGGVCIADEVQTGFGRTGTNFWGFENQGVIPDIVTMAKGIGNGLPLAAVVTTEEIAQTMSRRLHFNTFGGNPVCSAGGRAVLKAIEEDGLQANSQKVHLALQPPKSWSPQGFMQSLLSTLEWHKFLPLNGMTA